MSAFDHSPPVPEPRHERRLALLLLLIVLALVATVCWNQASGLRFDFQHFYVDAKYVWQHGALNPDLDERELPFYLPGFVLLIAPVAAAGPQIGALIWTAAQVGSLAISLVLLSDWCGRQRRPGRLAPLALATLLAAPALYEAARFNQLTFPVLALLLGFFALLERNRRGLAGVCLGLAIFAKLLPAIFLIWLALKRQWCAAAWCAAAFALFALGPPLVIFGPQQTWNYHAQWWDHNLHGAPTRGMVDPELRDHFIDRRNQALPAVLARWCDPTHPHRLPIQPLQLSSGQCVWIARGVLVALLLSLLAATRHAWQHLSPRARRGELVLYLLAMMFLSPLMRQYYLAWALPALVLISIAATQHVTPQTGRAALVGLVVWVLGMLLWMWQPARVAGAHWLMLVLLAFQIWIILRRFPGEHREEQETDYLRPAPAGG